MRISLDVAPQRHHSNPVMCPVLNHLTEVLNKIPPQDVHKSISLIQSNFFPNPQERSRIQESIARNQDSVLILEKEIENLKQALGQLESRRSNIREVNSIQHALLSSVRMLPDEILAEVFTYACSEPINICWGSDTIWSILRVCSRWRRIARDTPRMWSTFEISAKSNLTPNADMVLDRVRTCLELSRNTPLFLSFPSDIPYGSPVLPLSIYTDIAKHVDRWFSLTADGNLISYMMQRPQTNSFRALIDKRGLGNLRELHLHYQPDGGIFSDDIYGHGSDIFKSATALEVIKLSHIEELDVALDHLTYSKLRYLTLEHCHFYIDESTVSSFRAMTSLEVLVWANTCCSWEAGSQPSVLTLPSVRTLHLLDNEGPREWGDEYIWPAIEMPCLKTVQLKHDIVHFAPFWSLLKSSSSTITRLELGACSLEFFVDLIKETSSVEELSLIHPTDSAVNYFLMMVWNSKNSGEHMGDLNLKSLPSLRKLEIHGNFQRPREVISRLQMVMRSRSRIFYAEEPESFWPISPLTSVKFSSGSISDEDSRFIVQLINLGKELDIDVEVVKI